MRLQQRVEFEALVARLSGLFSALQPDQADRGIGGSLRQMGGFLVVDHCYVCQWCANGELMDHAYG